MEYSQNTVIFDLDGTLVDTANDIKYALEKSMEKYTIEPLDINELQKYIGKGSRFLIDRALEKSQILLSKHQKDELLQEFLKTYEINIDKYSKTYFGIIDCLNWLKKENIKVGICTNKSEFLAKKLINKLKLNDFFQAIIGGDSLSVRKPNPKHLIHTIEKLSALKSKTIMIGDSITDVKAARNADLPVLVVSWGYTEIPPEKLGGDLLIKHGDDLIEGIKTVFINNKKLKGEKIK